MDSIDMREYSKKLQQVQNGIISEDTWMEYCGELMKQVLEDAKDVMVRMKERGD
jgi:hypothetical protein